MLTGIRPGNENFLNEHNRIRTLKVKKVWNRDNDFPKVTALVLSKSETADLSECREPVEVLLRGKEDLQFGNRHPV